MVNIVHPIVGCIKKMAKGLKTTVITELTVCQRYVRGINQWGT
jgi:hypothetical protein